MIESKEGLNMELAKINIANIFYKSMVPVFIFFLLFFIKITNLGAGTGPIMISSNDYKQLGEQLYGASDSSSFGDHSTYRVKKEAASYIVDKEFDDLISKIKTSIKEHYLKIRNSKDLNSAKTKFSIAYLANARKMLAQICSSYGAKDSRLTEKLKYYKDLLADVSGTTFCTYYGEHLSVVKFSRDIFDVLAKMRDEDNKGHNVQLTSLDQEMPKLYNTQDFTSDKEIEKLKSEYSASSGRIFTGSSEFKANKMMDDFIKLRKYNPLLANKNYRDTLELIKKRVNEHIKGKKRSILRLDTQKAEGEEFEILNELSKEIDKEICYRKLMDL